MTQIDDFHSDNAKFPTDHWAVSNRNCTSLRSLCAHLHEKIEAFLREDVQSERLKAVQDQCKHSLCIISDALAKYPYVTL